MWGLTQPFKASKIMSLKAWKITCMVQVWQGCWIAKPLSTAALLPPPSHNRHLYGFLLLIIAIVATIVTRQVLLLLLLRSPNYPNRCELNKNTPLPFKHARCNVLTAGLLTQPVHDRLPRADLGPTLPNTLCTVCLVLASGSASYWPRAVCSEAPSRTISTKDMEVQLFCIALQFHVGYGRAYTILNISCTFLKHASFCVNPCRASTCEESEMGPGATTT